MDESEAFNEKLVIESLQLWEHLRAAVRVVGRLLTCSVELFSAVLGRLEDSRFSEVSDREEGLLEGRGDSGWWRSEWTDTAASAEKPKKDVHFQPVFQCCSAPVFKQILSFFFFCIEVALINFA